MDSRRTSHRVAHQLPWDLPVRFAAHICCSDWVQIFVCDISWHSPFRKCLKTPWNCAGSESWCPRSGGPSLGSDPRSRFVLRACLTANNYYSTANIRLLFILHYTNVYFSNWTQAFNAQPHIIMSMPFTSRLVSSPLYSNIYRRFDVNDSYWSAHPWVVRRFHSRFYHSGEVLQVVVLSTDIKAKIITVLPSHPLEISWVFSLQ